MPEKRLTMRYTREILRLHFESNLALRLIAKICKVAKSTVQRYLERRLFPPVPVACPEDTIIHL